MDVGIHTKGIHTKGSLLFSSSKWLWGLWLCNHGQLSQRPAMQDKQEAPISNRRWNANPTSTSTAQYSGYFPVQGIRYGSLARTFFVGEGTPCPALSLAFGKTRDRCTYSHAAANPIDVPMINSISSVAGTKGIRRPRPHVPSSIHKPRPHLLQNHRPDVPLTVSVQESFLWLAIAFL